ncbi:nucleoside phosphorylase domain-containing protein [Usnea florida]
MIHEQRRSFSYHSFDHLRFFTKSFIPPSLKNSIRPQHQSLLSTRPIRKMDNLPTTYTDPVPIAIIGGTGLSSLPSPLFEPLAVIQPTPTPWGLPSSPIAILRYTPQSSPAGLPSSLTPTVVAFLARHGAHHQYAPHEIPNRANVAALKKLGVKAAVGFSAVGSLREEVKPRDFLVAGGVVDWTKGVRPWTFFENGVVGHVSMADPFDAPLSKAVHDAISQPGVLEGEGVKAHSAGTVICIEGPQFSTRSESLLYRSLPTQPPISVINMSAVPEYKLFREAEIAYALICMSTDYDSWHSTNEGVSVEMVMGHMVANGANAKRAVAAVLEELSKEGVEGVVGERLTMATRGGVMGLHTRDKKGEEAVERLRWLFGEKWIEGGK